MSKLEFFKTDAVLTDAFLTELDTSVHKNQSNPRDKRIYSLTIANNCFIISC